MPTKSFRLTASHCFTFFVIGFCLIRINCADIPGVRQVRCELLEAVFWSANSIKVRWNSTGPTVDSFKCQLRISDTSCNNSLQQYEADSRSSERSVFEHTFWMDQEIMRRSIRSYRLCIRPITSDQASDQGEWAERTLNVSEREPPSVGNCSVSTGIEMRRTSFERQEVYLFRKGDIVKLSCIMAGKPFPSVKWYKNSIECSNGEEAVYALDSGSQEIEGVYTAVVYNAFGRVISEGMHLRQAVLGYFENDQSSSVVIHKAGDSFTLTCRTPTSVPAPEIRWIRKTSGGPDLTVPFDQETVLGLDGSLTILNANVSDSGNYVCKVFNRFNDQSQIQSQGTKVEIHTNETIFHAPPILQNKSPSNAETVLGVVGKTVRLQCIYSGRPTPVISWHKETIPLTFNERINQSADGFTLTLLRLKREDEGSYRCSARNSEGETQGFAIRLIVHESPSVFPSLESHNVTEGEKVRFSCVANGLPRPSVNWKINGETVTDDMKMRLNVSISSDQSTLTIYSVNINGSCALQCNVTNDYGYAVSSASLNVFSATRIVSLSPAYGGGHVMLTCEARTDPLTPVFYNWTHQEEEGGVVGWGDEAGIHTVFHNGSLVVNFTAASNEDSGLRGNYTCVAFNGLSSESRTIHVQHMSLERKKTFFQSTEFIGIFGVFLFGVSLTILIVILITYFMKRRRTRRIRSPTTPLMLSSSIVPQLSYSGHAEARYNNSHECLVRETDLCNGILHQNDQLKAAIRQMYIPLERIQLRHIIGKGQFGRVYSACLRDPRDIVEEVAVKTMKYKPDESEMVELFLREAVIMRDFEHSHVLGIRGITFDSDNSPMVILPFMANGDLRRYILQPDLDITILQLLLMGLQVARGMNYLSQKRFVHRDLAARNCMVNDRCIVKVADFGLSRQLVRDYYRVESNGTTPVPVRWMAPECLEANLFTTMSDVWSFGVLLWELMTRGAVPYPDVENWQIPNHVQSGKRLEQPVYCPDVVYEIMQLCWQLDQASRPSFQDLVDSIQTVVESVKPDARTSCFSLYHNVVQRRTASSTSDDEKQRSTTTHDYRKQ